MPLLSNLFRNDRALQACAVEDRAHVTVGAAGAHVGKIQDALAVLDGLVIDRTEVMLRRYGRSTAAAVLAYKTKRRIINRSYQTAPDNIVGKMTIASLDDEMRRRDILPKPPGDCALSPSGGVLPPRRGAALTGSAGRSLAGSSGLNVTAPRQLGGFIRVFFQITLRAAIEDGFPLSAHIERARDLLFEHGITLFVEFKNGFADTLQYSPVILHSDVSLADNVNDLREVSEKVRPGVPGVLRVIVCQMVSRHGGETFRNRLIGGRIVPPFVYLNSQETDLDRATLIHEMIHASKPRAVDHDKNPASVFFDTARSRPGEISRTSLPPEHALTLSKLSSKL